MTSVKDATGLTLGVRGSKDLRTGVARSRETAVTKGSPDARGGDVGAASTDRRSIIWGVESILVGRAV